MIIIGAKVNILEILYDAEMYCIMLMKNDREKIALFDDAYLLLVEFDFPPNPSHVGFVFSVLFDFKGYAWYGSVLYY